MLRTSKVAFAVGLIGLIVACGPGPAQNRTAAAESADVEINRSGGRICVSSNGLPGHATGTFPNSGNPHRIQAQNINVCVTDTPEKGATARPIRGTMGVAVNGVLIRPGTADYYDAGSRRGFSRDRSSGWNLEGLGAREMLGIDRNNAHPDNRGLYHYHGLSPDLAAKIEGTLIGWAADGFELHVAGSAQTSGWRLKPGTRPTEPFGAYDGTYVQDWEFADAGSLDECNGGLKDGRFVYFVTDTYPFFPRCLWGTPSRDFGRP